MTLHIIYIYTQGNVLYVCMFTQFVCCVFILCIYSYIYIIYKLNVFSCTFSNNIYKYQYMHMPGTTPKNAQ